MATSVLCDVPSAETGNARLLVGVLYPASVRQLLFRNLSLMRQDTWRVVSRLTLTYGLRWDVDFVPATTSGPNFAGVTGFNLSNISNLALAPGNSAFKTTYGNVAPRLGLAYQLSQSQDWQTVVRGGFGVFYDLATSETGTSIFAGTTPFGAV